MLPGKRCCISGSGEDPIIKERFLGNSLSEQGMLHKRASGHSWVKSEEMGFRIECWVRQDYLKTKVMGE